MLMAETHCRNEELTLHFREILAVHPPPGKCPLALVLKLGRTKEKGNTCPQIKGRSLKKERCPVSPL